jgi:integrase/recombinase XerD
MSTITLAALTRDIEGFILFKRTLGCRYEGTAQLLYRFKGFAEAYANASPRRRIALDALIRAWLSRPGVRKPTTTVHQFGTLRELCLYRHRRDPRSYVPDRQLAPRKGPRFLPYALSHDQVRTVIRAARSHPGSLFWGEMLELFVLMLYCTGLRPGEPLRLRLTDLDLKARTFLIRDSKGKTRIVPFEVDLARAIERYLRKRAAFASTGELSDYLLLDRNGQKLKMRSVTKVICKLFRRVGLKPSHGPGGPRAYDFRHAFAVHRLTDWYRKGVDLHARLPWLSAYMGHDELLGTEVYLHATPTLLRMASRRFAKRLKRGARQL